MNGFFTKRETQLKSGELSGKSCAACGLYKHCDTPRMAPYGKGGRGIMVIGDFPSEADDRTGKPFQSPSGKLLQRTYQRLGIDLFNDCICLNAVNCRPPVNKKGETRNPTDNEIMCCRGKILTAIGKYKPKVIVLHGGIPTTSLVAYRWRGGASGLNLWQGWAIPDREYNAWVCPTFSPEFIKAQDDKESEAGIIWERDLKRAFSKVGEPFPYPPDEEKRIIIAGDINEPLEAMEESHMFAFDIETTGLKPYNPIHRIVTISFCCDENKAYACPFPTSRKEIRRLKKLLENPNIGKIAANMKYEDTWMNVLQGIQVNPWKLDTMLSGHILDNRPGITGLKFQTFVQFGLLGYDDDVSPYLKAGGPHELNQVLELIKEPAGYRKLLLYNGIDSLVTYRGALLHIKQMKELDRLR